MPGSDPRRDAVDGVAHAAILHSVSAGPFNMITVTGAMLLLRSLPPHRRPEPRPHPPRSTIFRTGPPLTPSMPVSSSAFPASPPQPSWRVRSRVGPAAELEPIPSRAGDTAARSGFRNSATPPTVTRLIVPRPPRAVPAKVGPPGSDGPSLKVWVTDARTHREREGASRVLSHSSRSGS
jgi:hypothetical protein